MGYRLDKKAKWCTRFGYTLCFVFLGIGLLISLPLSASRADGLWRRFALPDGRTMPLQLCGDEYHHYYRAADGQIFLRAEGGAFEAVSQEDFSSGMSVAAQTRANANARRIGETAPEVYQGQRRQLLILVSFADQDFLQSDAETNQLWNHVANTAGFTNAWGAEGSVRDYFLAQSSGLFDMTCDVVGPIKLTNNAAYYGQNTGYSDNLNRVEQMVREACQAAAEQTNFADYDWSGDGAPEQVIIIYAGEGEATGGDDNTIWPRQSTVSMTLNGQQLHFKYVCINEAYDNGDGSMQTMGIGTLCHEFAHCLGLPDLYNTNPPSYSPNGGIVDLWDLMDGGNYTPNMMWTPIGFSAYERMFCGWLSPTELTDPASVRSLNTIAGGGTAYQIINDAADGTTDEYYLLENRQQQGWDYYLPGHGLVVTHIDYPAAGGGSRQPNNDMNHLRIAPIPADGDLTSYFTDATPLAHLAYPYVVDGVVMNNALTDDSSPAATVFRTNTSGTNLMRKPVTNITETASLVGFDFMGGAPDAISRPRTAEADTPGFELDGRPAGSSTRSRLTIKDRRKIFK